MAFPLSELLEGTLSPYILRIKDLYSSMDAAYTKAAESYGFRCGGCSESCCEERFYHYTLAEHLYLIEGMGSLDRETAGEVPVRAEDAAGLYRLHDLQGKPERVLCPLNFDGLCRLYEYRPMICRLHGIPHRMRKPGGFEQTGPGCHRFAEEITQAGLSEPVFDRTEYYSGMAALEIELRRLVNFTGRYRKTVAEMVIDIPGTMDKTQPRILL
jgi:Fe-S-cluster containining protein